MARVRRSRSLILGDAAIRYPTFAGEPLVDRAIDPDSHNLHAGVGQRCMICDRPIKRGQPVRRTVSGGFAHDNC